MILCTVIFVILIVFLNDILGRVKWENIRCSSDKELAVPEGIVADIGRFPWFGIVQHSFYLGGKTRFAVTNGVLVHPEYAIASAEDISKINIETVANNTKFILWQSESTKYAMDIETYYLSPEYTEGQTLASIALIQLFREGEGGTVAPVLPVCLPVVGVGTFSDMYAVKTSDENREIQKEVIKMEYVSDQECEEFYYNNKRESRRIIPSIAPQLELRPISTVTGMLNTPQLNFKMMTPVRSLCAASPGLQTCVWDAGVALVSRQTWGYWKLLGFSVRGPGCGAPVRFLPIQEYLLWIDETITRAPLEEKEKYQMLVFRRVSPIKLIMYKAKVRQPKEIGMCDRKTRGHVMYKDNTEILVNKNFAQGFFFMSLAQVAEITCMSVHMEVNSRTNAAIWIEHHCHQDLRGEREGRFFKDDSSRECFVYFKSETYIEFRFYFSFKAMLEVTLFGKEEVPKFIPNPFVAEPNTYNWRPTYEVLRTIYYMPYYTWWWSM